MNKKTGNENKGEERKGIGKLKEMRNEMEQT